MKSAPRIASLFLFVLLAPCSIFAQTSMGVNPRTRTATFNMRLSASAMQPVVGSPVSYEEVSQSSRLLADGTHITQKTRTVYFYRDSLGRTRTERKLFDGMTSGDWPSGITLIEIRDPVLDVQYIFDTRNQVAYRVPLTFRPPRGSSGGALVANSSPQTKTAPPVQAVAVRNDALRPQSTTESLGTDIMEGVSVEGHRTTRIFSVGSVGNDRPITETSEHWYSPDLHADILEKSSSLLNGDFTFRLANISRAEPDPVLFQVPAGYQVVDGPADGRITLKFQMPQK